MPKLFENGSQKAMTQPPKNIKDRKEMKQVIFTPLFYRGAVKQRLGYLQIFCTCACIDKASKREYSIKFSWLK